MDTPMEDITRELKELDKEFVHIDGILLKPSQCYRFEIDPIHLLFNTNCPESLKTKVQAILEKHLPAHETGSPE